MTFTQRLTDTLKRLLSSAKVITALVGLVVTFAAKHNVVLSPDDVNAIVTLFAALLIGQGATDFGKSAAQVKAELPAEPTQTQVVNVERK